MKSQYFIKTLLMLWVLNHAMTVNAQSDLRLQQLLQSHSSSITKLTSQLRQLKQDTAHYIEVKKLLDRILPIGGRQVYYIFYTKKYQAYELSLLTQGEQVFGVKLYKVNYNMYSFPKKIIKVLYSRVNSSVLQSYIQQHNTLYGSHLTTNDSLLLPFRLYKFGSDCGHSIPDEHRKMRQMVREKQEEGLQKWLRSMNVELQAYGAKGLAYLHHPEEMYQSKNQELRRVTPTCRKVLRKEKYLWRVKMPVIIKHLKKQSVKVYTCAGCFGMNYTPIQELVKRLLF